METTLDLTKYNFPKVTGVDLAFPTLNTDKRLLAEAVARGFDEHYNPYNRLVSQIFFSGGRLKFKEGVDEEFRKRALMYFRALIGSFAPKHEDKTAVCAMILSEIAEPELA